MDAGSLLSIISLALDTWSCQSPTVFCFVTVGPQRLRGSLAFLRQQGKIVCVIKWCYYGFAHTSECVFLLLFLFFPLSACCCTTPWHLCLYCMFLVPHRDEWINTKKRRQTETSSVLADSSDLRIYGETRSSDIHPGYFIFTAHTTPKRYEDAMSLNQVIGTLKLIKLEHIQK